MASTDTSTITDHELAQIDRANASGATPVAFVHGLWLLPNELGPLGDDVRGGRVHRRHPRLAGRPGDGRGGEGEPGGLRAQERRPDRRLRRRDHPPAGQEAGGDRPLVRRPAHADPRRPRARRRVGGDRPGAVPRRAAAADLGAALRDRRCSRTRPTATGPSRSRTTSSATASPTRSTRTRRRSCSRRTPCRARACRSSRPRPRT